MYGCRLRHIFIWAKRVSHPRIARTTNTCTCVKTRNKPVKIFIHKFWYYTQKANKIQVLSIYLKVPYYLSSRKLKMNLARTNAINLSAFNTLQYHRPHKVTVVECFLLDKPFTNISFLSGCHHCRHPDLQVLDTSTSQFSYCQIISIKFWSFFKFLHLLPLLLLAILREIFTNLQQQYYP